jgi:hypothetical protein
LDISSINMVKRWSLMLAGRIPKRALNLRDHCGYSI